MSVISMKYNTIKSCRTKSAMKEEKEWNGMSFYKTQKSKHSILIRSDVKCFKTFKTLH